jgi:sigma-B regulation protein RsbU (phosphoserine phosphatase)
VRVLVADDEPLSRELLQRKLASWGHEVSVAQNGAEAWEILQQERIELVIADWMMPVIDGIELCQKVRTGNHKGFIYFILLTARDAREDTVRGLEAGADDYMKKPFDWDELRARIRAGERIVNLIAEVRTLSGLIPICAACKRIRNDTGYWQQVETYFADRAGAEFTHGICPQCAVKLGFPPRGATPGRT